MVNYFYALTLINVYERQRNRFLCTNLRYYARPDWSSWSTHSSDDTLSQSQLLKEWNGNSSTHETRDLLEFHEGREKGNWLKAEDVFNDLKVLWGVEIWQIVAWAIHRESTESEVLHGEFAIHKLYRLMRSYLQYRLVLETVFLRTIPKSVSACITKEMVLYEFKKMHWGRLKLTLN